MLNRAKVILIPIPIAEGQKDTLSLAVSSATSDIKHYMVENVRTARRFLKWLHPQIVIDELEFAEFDKHKGADLEAFRRWLKQGATVGVLSESGCPGIADPGAEVVAIAQELDIEVIPLVGPNSLILALMASGLNGQRFAFNGYLPVKEPARTQKIKQLEQVSKKEQQTQIFIETPYRNNQILEDLLRHCNHATRICIAQNLTASDQWIKTKRVGDWNKKMPALNKVPTVFLIQAE